MYITTTNETFIQPQCIAGCPCPTWNNQPNQHCCRTCYNGRKCIHSTITRQTEIERSRLFDFERLSRGYEIKKSSKGFTRSSEIMKSQEIHIIPFNNLISKKLVGLVGFYYPSYQTPADAICNCGFLGNFYETVINFASPTDPKKEYVFKNAEALFQALKFWNYAEKFTNMTGSQAFQEKMKWKGYEDWTYAGFGNNWLAMFAVLRAKFRQNENLMTKLISTDNAFLIEHNVKPGRDKIWSDNSDGEGFNWLGLQLMIIRDELRGTSEWTEILYNCVDMSNGNIKPESEWQNTVRLASRTLAKYQ